MSDDRLATLLARLDDLGGEPVSGHPAALDEVHRTLVAELESLAAAPRTGDATGTG